MYLQLFHNFTQIYKKHFSNQIIARAKKVEIVPAFDKFRPPQSDIEFVKYVYNKCSKSNYKETIIWNNNNLLSDSDLYYIKQFLIQFNHGITKQYHMQHSQDAKCLIDSDM